MARNIKPIRNTKDHEAALAEVERRAGAKSGTPRRRPLTPATLIDAYEDKHFPMDQPDPIEAIKFRMEQQGLTRKDLEEMIQHGRGLPRFWQANAAFPLP